MTAFLAVAAVVAANVQALTAGVPALPADICDVPVVEAEALALCAGDWAPVVWCESSGLVDAVNPADVNGRRSMGAIQFQQATWDWITQDMGRPDLAGTAPHTVKLATQLAAADFLAFEAAGGGLSHWPFCGRFYGGCFTRGPTVCAPNHN